jgi:hypothetical protein
MVRIRWDYRLSTEFSIHLDIVLKIKLVYILNFFNGLRRPWHVWDEAMIIGIKLFRFCYTQNVLAENSGKKVILKNLHSSALCYVERGGHNFCLLCYRWPIPIQLLQYSNLGRHDVECWIWVHTVIPNSSDKGSAQPNYYGWSKVSLLNEYGLRLWRWTLFCCFSSFLSCLHYVFVSDQYCQLYRQVLEK